MEPIEDFENFYARKIKPHLGELSNGESSADNWKKFAVFTGIGAFGSFFLFYLKLLPSGHILAGAMLISCIIGVYFYTRYKDKYIDDFKEKIIGQIITYIHPQAVYKPMGFVSKKEYKASGLFRRRFTHFDGDDYWQSVFNDVAFHCSEIKSWYSDPTGSEQIFQGLFFVATISNTFSGGTYIWSKGHAQLPASMADEHYRMYPLPHVQRMKVAHEGFNKYYTVHTTNAGQASLLLSYNMLDHIVLIKEKLKRNIVFSFVAGKCYIAVPFEENLLEPSKNGVRDKEEVKNYFFTILLVFNLIKTLELNRLI